jgi:hypothetical protein
MKADYTIRFAAVLACLDILLVLAAPASAETALYSFGVSAYDGVLPIGGLIEVNGKLYGTTIEGGMSTACNGNLEPGCGMVFSITARGRPTSFPSRLRH